MYFCVPYQIYISNYAYVMSNENVYLKLIDFYSNIAGFLQKVTQIPILKNSAKWITLKGCHFLIVHHIDLIFFVLNIFLPKFSYLDKKIIFQ